MRHLVGSLAIASSGLMMIIGNAHALDEPAQLQLGQNEYNVSCAACHGAKGRGDGPVAQVLSTAPPDLTKISQQFNGQFPSDHIYQVIDGRQMINPHGDKQMPIWGYRYMSEAQRRDHEVPHEVDTQALVYGRITALVQYLESIQSD